MPQIPLMNGTKASASTDYLDALPENFIVVVGDVRGAPGYLLSHAGLTLHATGFGIDRGGYWNERQNAHYRVSGTRFISIDTRGVVSDLGEILGEDQVSFAHSFNNQSIVAGLNWYLWDGTTLTKNPDVDVGNPISHCWIQNYFFFTDGATLYHTNLAGSGETSIDPLDFATSEFSPDPTLAVARTSDNQVVVFNRYTTEWFINNATENFAFQHVGGKSVKCGSIGSHSWCELTSTFYVLGGGREESPSINAISAGQYQSITSRSVDQIIESYTQSELSKAVLETRTQDRDKFVIVRLPLHTLLFNATVAAKWGAAQAWTIVKTGTAAVAPWRGVNGVSVPNVGWVYGDALGPNIGLLDWKSGSQYGEVVESILYTPLIQMPDQSIHEIEMDILPGHQVNLDDVTVAVSTTYDGITWGSEWWDLYGEQSKYGIRFIARRLGNVQNFIGFKFRAVTVERLAFSRLTING